MKEVIQLVGPYVSILHHQRYLLGYHELV